MRGIWGLAGLLVVLAIVGVIVKKQLTAVSRAPLPVPQGAPAVSGPAASGAVQQQYRQALEGALQSPRPMQEDR